MMNIEVATETYEAWAFSQIEAVSEDLARKHRKMAQSPFPFLRATFYRWAQLWPKRCKDLADAPRVLAVGDLHVENFGTWRDLEGRLVWGINDFDEVYPAAYTVDLVRLATSALLAFDEGKAAFGRDQICQSILDGYTEQLNSERPTPFVLDGSNRWLRLLALGEIPDPRLYWAKFSALKPPRPAPSAKLKHMIAKLFPERGLEVGYTHRVAGLGSLGRQRVLARATWHGSTIAREAKALLPSAWVWARGKGSTELRYNEALHGLVRCPDPFVMERDGWIIRRLAPDCTDIDLTDLPKRKLEQKLLRAMGAETANMHLGTAKARGEIARDLKDRKSGWLEKAADAMVVAIHDDFGQWQTHASVGAGAADQVGEEVLA